MAACCKEDLDPTTKVCCDANFDLDQCPVEPDPVVEPEPEGNLAFVIVIIFAFIIVAIILAVALFWFLNKKNKSRPSSGSTVDRQPPARDSQNDLFESRRGDIKANGSDKSPDHVPLDASQQQPTGSIQIRGEPLEAETKNEPAFDADPDDWYPNYSPDLLNLPAMNASINNSDEI